MTVRALLVRGLLAGLLAGLATFLVAHEAGEPHVEAAIALEESAAGHDHATEEEPVITRADQRTWGLLTGSVAVGTALGGLVALVSAATVGRVGRLTPGQSTALVSAAGFVAVSLVPFLKYPATPPAVGSPDTIGDRTGDYFAFVAISVVAAVLATVLAARLWPRRGTYVAVLAGAGAYLAAVLVAGLAMPAVNEAGDFPADTLWYFRRASLLTLAALWAVLGVVLTGLVGRLGRAEESTTRRRELAASL